MATDNQEHNATTRFDNVLRPPILEANPTHSDWRYFRRTLENYMQLLHVANEMKLPLLQTCIGRDGNDILDGLPTPANAGAHTFENAMAQLETYFCGGSSVLLRRKLFFEARQARNESITEFSCRLRRLAKDCDFGISLDTMLRDIFVIGVWNDKLGESLLALDASTLTFAVAVQKSEAFERARSERHKVGHNQDVHGATVSNIKRSGNASTPNIRDTGNASPNPTAQLCYRCGRTNHLANSVDCPAKSAICKGCGKSGHFKLMCRSAQHKDNSVTKHKMKRESVCQITENQTQYNVFATTKTVSQLVNREVLINGAVTNICVDTGAEVNTIPVNLVPGLKLRHTASKLKAWGNFDIPVLGEIDCTVEYKTIKTSATFVVVNIIDVKPLFSLRLCQTLGIINELMAFSTTHSRESPVALPHKPCRILSDFQNIFRGTGLLKTGYEYKPTLTADARPLCAPARRLPPALGPKVKAKLDELERCGIIKKVTQSTEFCAPIVVTYKKNSATDVRLTTDF